MEEEHPPQQNAQGNIKLLQNGQRRKLVQTYFDPSPTLCGGKNILKQTYGFLPTDHERGELRETKQREPEQASKSTGY